MALLQVDLIRDNAQLTSISEYQEALRGSQYVLDVEQTELNDGIAMIEVEDEEAERLMEEGEEDLPSGYKMVIDTF